MASPAPLLALKNLPAKPTKPYLPKLKHERVSYEFPPPPPPPPVKPLQSRPIRRHMPMIIGSGVALYLIYTAWYAVADHSEERTLTPEKFATYVISHKQQIDKDHFLVELSPKSSGSWFDELKITKDTWDGSRIWSIEVKQPEIMVVRKYTPLPLHFLKDPDHPELEPLLKITNPGDDSGRLVLYVKRYAQGEVARWLCSRAVGAEIEIRGPFTEFVFPKHPLDDWVTKPKMLDLPSKILPDTDLCLVIPEDKLAGIPEYDNLAFYGAGTGIAPLLQVLLSPNPYKGFIDVHYSVQTAGEIPIQRFLYFLEKLDRVKMNYYVNEKGNHLKAENVIPPIARCFNPSNVDDEDEREKLIKQKMEELSQSAKPVVNYQLSEHFNTALEQALVTAKVPKKGSSLALVCGPDGYVAYVAGAKLENQLHPMDQQGPVKGVLGAKGWDEDNVYKL
ncbi:hypothetical protein BABINDRAFT_39921 [Babjeviella inositovora NRRL Y-12698]|uniref:FAD-binding FR-type domain-containing protein n=1 Tax=Babjeviella inositovora NRRL Y-12698 TaxID=984486 RepID=A0A1E3QKH9_9ASCO|nr:uncharacterized protein BABINDRAFT_39921 [Babjeviella inositovora NRRL Y-12698]ODQ78209.1 hypothetical protein BABINDRAFT_39921 [Babjeviella inositovora NRRL Y-12698]